MITITKPLLLAFRAVRRDERGAGLVELALIAPMLAVLTVGIVDLTQGVTRRMQLHDAAHRTLEKVAARNFKLDLKSDGEPDTVLIEAEAEAAAGPGSEATVYSWLECDGESSRSSRANAPPWKIRIRVAQIRRRRSVPTASRSWPGTSGSRWRAASGPHSAPSSRQKRTAPFRCGPKRP
jgi:Flp pilus assembly pilin Flp